MSCPSVRGIGRSLRSALFFKNTAARVPGASKRLQKGWGGGGEATNLSGGIAAPERGFSVGSLTECRSRPQPVPAAVV